MKRLTVADYKIRMGTNGGFSNACDRLISIYGDIENFIACEFQAKGKLISEYVNAKTQIDRWNAIREYYAFIQPELDITDHNRWVAVYEMPFDDYFTPIERDAWHCIRYYNAVFYPQYPVFNYFIDFANPRIKLALEMDGKDYHDPVKDAERDAQLCAAGWHVYRIPGRECYTKHPDPHRINEKYEENSDEWDDAMMKWYTDTSEGLIRALKYSYYEPGHQRDHPYWHFIHTTLVMHRSYGRRSGL